MRIEIKEVKIYNFDELSKQAKHRVIDDFQSNNFYDYVLDEYLTSVKSLSKKIGGTFDYLLSLEPISGEFLKINDYDNNLLKDLIKNKDNCPLTGTCCDVSLLDALEKNNLQLFIDTIHTEYEYHLNENQIAETCEVNGYEFLEDGTFY